MSRRPLDYQLNSALNRSKTKIITDPILITSVFVILVFGLICLYSASGQDISMVTKQGIYIALGIFLMLLISLIKENFKKDSILAKEFKIYKSLIESKNLSNRVAEKLIYEARREYKSLDREGVFEAQSRLINQINKTLSRNIFSNFVVVVVLVFLLLLSARISFLILSNTSTFLSVK